MYKIYSKLVFFLKKINTLKKKKKEEEEEEVHAVQHCSLNSAINTTVQEKHVTLASSNPALQTQKVMGPINSN